MTLQTYFEPHTLETAPENAVKTLENVHNKFGKIPNIIATMANSPVAVNSYGALGAHLANSGFDPKEMQIINLTISVENDCHYCIAAHSTALKKGMKVDPSIVSAIRSKEVVDQPEWQALVALLREILANKGAVSDKTVTAFLDAGYSKRQMLDLLPAIAMKTLTNYLDHMTQIELDPAYRDEAVT